MSGGIRGLLCRAALGAVGVGAGLLVPTAGAVAPNPPCGSTVTTDVTLHSDMNCGVDALIVGASGITINLNDFAITNHGTPMTQTGIRVAGHNQITVKDGTVSGFAMGVDFQRSRDDTIDHVSANRNTFGIDLAKDVKMNVRFSQARHNAIDGVALYGDNMVTLASSDFSDNAPDGCFDDNHPCGGLVADRSLDAINDDTFVGNGGFGLLVDHPPTEISSSGTRVFEIASSRANQNRLAGFAVHHNSPTTGNQPKLVNNRAAFNGTFGFWALEPVEGSDNIARDNTSGNCHNVPCTSPKAPTP